MSSDHDSYTVGWISALDVELSAAQALLDEEHEDLEGLPGDGNTYSLGRIGNHNVVIACLPQGTIGTTPAATVAANLLRSFPNVRFGLMVGIGGGVPDAVSLGDVVVSKPENQIGGVIQYDLGKSKDTFVRQGILPPPPTAISTAVSKLSAIAMRKGYKLNEFHEKMLEDFPAMRQFRRPQEDILFEKDYAHIGSPTDCSRCDPNRIVKRSTHSEPKVHYGLIGSGNSVIRNATQRDNLYEQEGVICFEMEAAGLMKDFPCLVIRGICDYCDSHKNKEWQPYASAVAAAYAKELLLTLPKRSVETMPKSKLLESIKNDLSEIKDQNARNVVTQQSSALRQALSWVAAPDPVDNYERAKQLKEPQTGAWVVASKEYVRWKTSSTRHLWLYGKAGSGKSVLTATAILDIQQHCADANAGSAMFYFTFTDVHKQSWMDCLKSLVAQTADREPAVSTLIDAHQSSRDSSGPSQEVLRKLFLTAMNSYESFLVVLDGLDESPEELDGDYRIRYILFKNLISLSTEAPNLKFFLTSRDLIDIRGYMNELAAKPLPMASEIVDIDIKIYVISQLKKDTNLARLSTEMKDKIELTLVEKADGMFRWVYCQLHQLKKLRLARSKDVIQALNTLPATLDETYERILNDIDSIECEKAVVLLRWLAYARTPLSIRELAETVIIDPNNEPAIADPVEKPIPTGILGLLSGLIITIAREESRDEHRNDWEESSTIDFSQDENFLETRIQLAHFSVKEYLESERSISLTFRLDQEHSEQFLLDCCFIYLMYYANNEGRAENYEDLETFPLLHYSARYWYRHYCDTGNLQTVLSFLRCPEALRSWRKVHSPGLPGDDDFNNVKYKVVDNTPITALYFASLLGFNSIVAALIKLDGTTNIHRGSREDALVVAAKEGHKQIVEMLIGDGANVNAQGFLGTALIVATANGHQEISERLMEAGADVNIQALAGIYPSVLAAAAHDGQKDTVRMLIEEHNVDVNAQSEHGNSALMIAALGGNGHIVKMLIEAGANVNLQAKKGIHGTALIAALWGRNEHIIKMLIEARVDLNLQAEVGKYGTALIAAVCGRNEHIVKMLIEARVDVNLQAKVGTYGTALIAAVAYGHIGIVKMLTEDYGADANTQCGHYSSALIAAAKKGHRPIVRILIEDHGANVDARGKTYGNALISAATSPGNRHIIEMLIEKYGADANAQVPEAVYGNALVAAAGQGSRQIFRMLIKAGANINIRAGPYNTALQAAAQAGHDRMVEFLIEEYKVDVNAQGGHYGCALNAAVVTGREHICKILMEAGADINAQGGLYGNALIAATYWNRE